MTIAQLIYERRTALHLSRTDIGLACGYTGVAARSVVMRWEHGGCLPPVERVRRLAAVLRVQIDSLVP